MNSKTRPNSCYPPIVTIGVCVKNGAAVVGDAIESIKDQDYPHELMELICVDDGSQDDTLSVVQSYSSKLDIRTTIFSHRWKGLGTSRSVVVDNASGKYIVWVDADMFITKDFVSRQVEYMEANPVVGIGKGQYGICPQESVAAYLENIEFVAAQFKRRIEATPVPFGTGGSIYRTKAIRQIHGFDRNIKGSGEDVDAEHRIRLAGWFLHATSAVFYERRRMTWRSLWNEYFWLGKGGSTLFKKNKELVGPKTLWLPSALKVELARVVAAYRLTRNKIVFLLPFHYIFKRIAWLLGFLRASQ